MNPNLGEARALLPGWVPWLGPALAVAVAALVPPLCTWLAVAVAARPLMPAYGLGARLHSLALAVLVLRPSLPLVVVAIAAQRVPLGVWIGATAAALLIANSGVVALAAARLGVLPRARPKLAEAIARAGGDPRRTVELPITVLNAFAMPLIGLLGFTTPAVAQLDGAELEAIARHEIGHLTESRGVLAMRLFGGTAVTVLFAFAARLFAGSFGAADASGKIGAVVVFLVGMMARNALRRVAQRMEERADRHAHDGEPEPGGYARALERLYRLNLLPAVSARNQVHPALFDRMRAAGVEPDYPRPAPPSYGRALGALLAVVLALAVFGVAAGALRAFEEDLGGGDLRLALGGDARDLMLAGAQAWGAGDVRRGVALYGAGLWNTPPGPHLAPAWRSYAGMLAYAHRCDEARVALAMAGERDHERAAAEAAARQVAGYCAR